MAGDKMIKYILVLMLLLLGGCAKTDADVSLPLLEINANTTYTFNQDDFYTDYNDAVLLKNTNQTIEINRAGTYLFSGNYQYGVVVNAPQTDTVRLVLENAHWENCSTPAIDVLSAKKVQISLPKGMTTKISSASSGDCHLINAKAPLIFNGEGTLQMTASDKTAIQADDDLIFISGNYNINSVNQAINSNRLIAIYNAGFNINSQSGDAIHLSDSSGQGIIYIQDGSFHLTSQADGIASDGALIIQNGSFDITTSANDDNISQKGLKAGNILQVNDGTYTLKTSDDAIHCKDNCTLQGGTYAIKTSGKGVHADACLTINDITLDIHQCDEGLEAKVITINQGNLKIKANDDGINASDVNSTADRGAESGCEIIFNGGKTIINASGDGLDSNDRITINGGEIYVYSDGRGDGALDYESEMVIYGGTLIACGYSQMAALPSGSSSQASVVFRLDEAVHQKATFTNNNDKIIIAWCPDGAYDHVIISSPKIESGNVYILTIGDQRYDITTAGTINYFGTIPIENRMPLQDFKGQTTEMHFSKKDKPWDLKQ